MTARCILSPRAGDRAGQRLCAALCGVDVCSWCPSSRWGGGGAGGQPGGSRGGGPPDSDELRLLLQLFRLAAAGGEVQEPGPPPGSIAGSGGDWFLAPLPAHARRRHHPQILPIQWRPKCAGAPDVRPDCCLLLPLSLLLQMAPACQSTASAATSEPFTRPITCSAVHANLDLLLQCNHNAVFKLSATAVTGMLGLMICSQQRRHLAKYRPES